MNHSDINSSSAQSLFYYSECDNFYDRVGQVGGMSTGLFILHVAYLLEVLLGAPPNLWLLHHILKKRSRAGGILPADFLSFHMALIQMIFFFTPTLSLPNHFFWKSDAVMDAVTVLNSTVLIMKPLFLSMVSVEWYIAVVRPLDYIRTTKRCYRWSCVVTIWCIYVMLMVQAIYKRQLYLITMVQFPVLVVDTFCFISILTALRRPPPGDRRASEGEKKAPNKKLKESREMNSMKKKAFITIAVIQIVLTLNYLPFIIVIPLNSFVPPLDMKCQWVPLALTTASSCSYLQPLLYLYRLGQLPCISQRHNHKASQSTK